MSTDAQKRASTNYNRRQDNIMIRPNKEEGAAIRTAAAAAGMSVQAYVLRAVRVWMEQERTMSDHGSLPIGTADIEDKQKAPQGTAKEAGGTDGDVGDLFVSSEGTPASQAIAAISHTRDEKLPPDKLSPDDWAEWAHRQDDELLEDWMTRLKKSNIGTSPADIIKRIGKLPKHDRDLILGAGPAAGGRRTGQ